MRKIYLTITFWFSSLTGPGQAQRALPLELPSYLQDLLVKDQPLKNFYPLATDQVLVWGHQWIWQWDTKTLALKKIQFGQGKGSPDCFYADASGLLAVFHTRAYYLDFTTREALPYLIPDDTYRCIHIVKDATGHLLVGREQIWHHDLTHNELKHLGPNQWIQPSMQLLERKGEEVVWVEGQDLLRMDSLFAPETALKIHQGFANLLAVHQEPPFFRLVTKENLMIINHQGHIHRGKPVLGERIIMAAHLSDEGDTYLLSDGTLEWFDRLPHGQKGYAPLPGLLDQDLSQMVIKRQKALVGLLTDGELSLYILSPQKLSSHQNPTPPTSGL